MRREQASPARADTDAAALVDRLQKLRNLLPAFAQEAAAARREAARLRLQNTKLQTRLAELEARPRQHDTTTINRKSFHPKGKLALRLG
jgi:phage shock protein A